MTSACGVNTIMDDPSVTHTYVVSSRVTVPGDPGGAHAAEAATTGAAPPPPPPPPPVPLPAAPGTAPLPLREAT